MKTLKLTMLAAAALGLVSQTAFADTLPGQAVPSLHRLHPAKIVRYSEKRHGTDSADGAGAGAGGGGGGLGTGGGLVIGTVVGGLAGAAIVNSTKNSGSPQP